jgi:non-ribosomal peptide synthetase component F
VDERNRERENGKSEVTLRLAYQSPGGMLGTISDRASAPLVRRNLRDSLLRLQGELEGKPVKTESGGPGVLDWVKQQALAAKVFTQSGVLRPDRPDRIVRTVLALNRWGPTPAAGYAAAAVRFPDAEALVDELGSLTFGEIHRRTNALAHAFSDHGIKEGDGVAIMCRDHRGFIDATVAVSKLGANSLYMNTSFAGPQLTEVADREKPNAIV